MRVILFTNTTLTTFFLLFFTLSILLLFSCHITCSYFCGTVSKIFRFWYWILYSVQWKSLSCHHSRVSFLLWRFKVAEFSRFTFKGITCAEIWFIEQHASSSCSLRFKEDDLFLGWHENLCNFILLVKWRE